MDYTNRLAPELAELYLEASADRSLDPEVRLLRAQLAEAVSRADYQAEGWILELLIKATRANTGGGDSGLASVFDRVADELVSDRPSGSAARRVEPGSPKRPGRRVKTVAPVAVERPLTVAEAAQLLGLSVRQVGRMVAGGRLEAVTQPGDRRKKLISVNQVRELVEERRV